MIQFKRQQMQKKPSALANVSGSEDGSVNIVPHEYWRVVEGEFKVEVLKSD